MSYTSAECSFSQEYIVAEAKYCFKSLNRNRLSVRHQFAALQLQVFLDAGLIQGLVYAMSTCEDVSSFRLRILFLLAQIYNKVSQVMSLEWTHFALNCHLESPYPPGNPVQVPRLDPKRLDFFVFHCNTLMKALAVPKTPKSLALRCLVERYSTTRDQELGVDLNFSSKKTAELPVIQLRIKDCGVITPYSNPTSWDWNTISLILWHLKESSIVGDPTCNKFMDLLLKFYHPSLGEFAKLNDDTGLYGLCGVYLFQIIATRETISEQNLISLVTDLGRDLTKDRLRLGLFSFKNLASSSVYFLLLGELSASDRGRKILESARIFQKLFDCIRTDTPDAYVKLIISSLDYVQEGGQSRLILKQALMSSSEPCRIYATQYLSIVLLRLQVPSTMKWVIDCLIEQLNDTSKAVVATAIQSLEEVLQDPSCCGYFKLANPALDQLGEFGVILRSYRFSRNALFPNKRSEPNIGQSEILQELELWQNKYNEIYVDIVEEALHGTFTSFHRNYQGSFSRRSSNILSVDHGWLPSHLYGILSDTVDGLKTICQHGSLVCLVQTMFTATLSDERSTKRMKSAMWALAHILSNEPGVQLMGRYLIPVFVRIAEQCPVPSISGSAFFMTSLIARTAIGRQCLIELGWDTPGNRHLITTTKESFLLSSPRDGLANGVHQASSPVDTARLTESTIESRLFDNNHSAPASTSVVKQHEKLKTIYSNVQLELSNPNSGRATPSKETVTSPVTDDSERSVNGMPLEIGPSKSADAPDIRPTSPLALGSWELGLEELQDDSSKSLRNSMVEPRGKILQNTGSLDSHAQTGNGVNMRKTKDYASLLSIQTCNSCTLCAESLASLILDFDQTLSNGDYAPNPSETLSRQISTLSNYSSASNPPMFKISPQETVDGVGGKPTPSNNHIKFPLLRHHYKRPSHLRSLSTHVACLDHLPNRGDSVSVTNLQLTSPSGSANTNGGPYRWPGRPANLLAVNRNPSQTAAQPSISISGPNRDGGGRNRSISVGPLSNPQLINGGGDHCNGAFDSNSLSQFENDVKASSNEQDINSGRLAPHANSDQTSTGDSCSKGSSNPSLELSTAGPGGSIYNDNANRSRAGTALSSNSASTDNNLGDVTILAPTNSSLGPVVPEKYSTLQADRIVNSGNNEVSRDHTIHLANSPGLSRFLNEDVTTSIWPEWNTVSDISFSPNFLLNHLDDSLDDSLLSEQAWLPNRSHHANACHPYLSSCALPSLRAYRSPIVDIRHFHNLHGPISFSAVPNTHNASFSHEASQIQPVDSVLLQESNNISNQLPSLIDSINRTHLPDLISSSSATHHTGHARTMLSDTDLEGLKRIRGLQDRHFWRRGSNAVKRKLMKRLETALPTHVVPELHAEDVIDDPANDSLDDLYDSSYGSFRRSFGSIASDASSIRDSGQRLSVGGQHQPPANTSRFDVASLYTSNERSPPCLPMNIQMICCTLPDPSHKSSMDRRPEFIMPKTIINGLDNHMVDFCLRCSPNGFIKKNRSRSNTESGLGCSDSVSQNSRSRTGTQLSHTSDAGLTASSTVDDTSSTATVEITDQQARQEILRLVCVINVRSTYAEKSLLRLKTQLPSAFQSLCNYCDIAYLLGRSHFRLSSRRFLQELFQDVDFSDINDSR